ncbi:hypothetical protein B0H67DRAFT_494721 [Lasiosphaeris hirsuta]|uniref:Uncharacterized protein n=1 Tax=Lasiosphaeris hirsuta TaxID=260670 RepID=A0AA40A2J3_9PEZI|nr:hypothetical protein B0H67DRAFT_494721 [Lasiosphaeris hirsuta]
MVARNQGPEIWGSRNEIDECEMHQAIECLHEQICTRRKVPFEGKIRCTIGSAVAYLCNYESRNNDDGQLECSESEMYEAWRQIRIAKASATGWWYDEAGSKTYGFDRRCRDNECDNGWKEGSEGEQCTNIKGGADDWVFDYESETYPNFTAQYIQALPEPGDESEPIYFRPWHEGTRPR